MSEVENKKDIHLDNQFCILQDLDKDSINFLDKKLEKGLSCIPEVFSFPKSTEEEVKAFADILGTYILDTMFKSGQLTKFNNCTVTFTDTSGESHFCFACPRGNHQEYKDILNQSIKRANSVLSVLTPGKQFPSLSL